MDNYEIYTALVTPVLANGEINYQELEKLIRFQISNKVTGIVIFGTTGLGYLYQSKLLEVVDFTLSIVETTVKVIVGISQMIYQQLAETITKLNDLPIDGYLILTPHYLTVSQIDLYNYYQKINEIVNHPIIIYHVPKRTSQAFTDETILRCLELKWVEGIKLASFSHITLQKIRSQSQHTKIYLGSDDAIDHISEGFNGIISVFSNLNPQLLKKGFNNLFIANKLKKFFKILFQYPNPVGIISLLNTEGYQIGNLPFPFTNLPITDVELLKNAYQKLIEKEEHPVVIVGDGKMGKKLKAFLNEYQPKIIDLQVVNWIKKELLENAKVIIDFSHPNSLNEYYRLDYKNEPIFIIGTTGYENMDKMIELSTKHPVLYDSNFSKGIKIITRFLKEFRKSPFFCDYAKAIKEIHHVQKIDSPSGTAKSLRNVIGKDCEIESKRIGDIKGIHEIEFKNQTEKIIFSHLLLDRKIICLGVLESMKFLLNQQKGLYSYEEVVFDEQNSD